PAAPALPLSMAHAPTHGSASARPRVRTVYLFMDGVPPVVCTTPRKGQRCGTGGGIPAGAKEKTREGQAQRHGQERVKRLTAGAAISRADRPFIPREAPADAAGSPVGARAPSDRDEAE